MAAASLAKLQIGVTSTRGLSVPLTPCRALTMNVCKSLQKNTGRRSISTASSNRSPSIPRRSPTGATRIHAQCRLFSASATQHAPKTVQQVQARNRSGPFSWKAGVIFVGTGIGLIIYFRYEKDRMQRKRIAEQNKGIGKPLIGGKFDLVDTEGNKFTEKDLLGKYSLIYFGFTHCPDICPDELDKMAKMIELVKQRSGKVLKPVFISCDPWRDSPQVVKKYLHEFHPEIIGLTGEYENVKDVCKVYRVYFSTPPQLQPGQDYIVDHSIYFYLMDPEGDFVEAIGRERTAQQGADAICEFAKDWKGPIDRT